MEPAGSLEVTIDSLLSAIASASLAVTNFIRSVRSARTDLVAVTRELSDLKLELELLRDEPNVPRRPHSHARSVLESCGVVLSRIGSLLRDSLSKADAGRPARWSVKERFETTNLCNCLQVYREALNILLEMTQLSAKDVVPPDGRDVDPEEVEEKASRILESISDLREAIPQAEVALGDSREVLESYLTALTTSTIEIRDELIHGESEQPITANNTKPLDPPPRSAQRKMTTSSTAPARAPSQRTAAQADSGTRPPITDRPSHGTPDINGELEAAGPWFPTTDMAVPYYNNQELVLPPRTTSFHVPRRSPPPLSPFPRAHHSSPPMPPPRGALPSIPTASPRRGTNGQARHPAELAGSDGGEVRHVAQYYNASHQVPRQQMHSKEGLADRRNKTMPVQNIVPVPLNGHGDYVSEVATRNRSASEHHWPQPPHPQQQQQHHQQHQYQHAETWSTSMYVPTTPTTSEFSSSQRTSFQPSSIDSMPSRDTYRSSVSTGPLSLVDSASPNTSPRAQLEPTFEEIRPPSPRPPTTRSSGSASNSATAKNTTLRDKLPGVFRTKRKSFQGSDGAGSIAFRDSLSSNSSSTVDPTRAPSSIGPTESVLARRAARQIEIVPAEGLSDSAGKGVAIHHIEISPTRTVVATQHANNTVKVWSITTGAVDGLIKYSSKVTAGPRTRMYFVRPQVILSEASTLVAITASFGNTIEIWNWSKKKRLQMIDHASRWACVPGDVFEANMPPLAVYRAESEKIDLWTVTREPKRPFVHLKSRSINLNQAGLPFIPKFPDLAYSATGPLLVGAAGPRPGAPKEEQNCMLLAWQIDAQNETPTSQPYRWLIPEHPELDGSLPAALATYGSVAVSIWHPANYKQIVTAQGENKKVPIVVTTRHVLVWDLATNRSRLFSIPNVLSCISPDCRYLAYCDPAQQRFVVMDVTSQAEIWSGPDEIDIRQAGAAGSQQLLGDLSKVTEFRFTEDSNLLFVADDEGGIGIYEIRHGDGGRNGSVSTAPGGAGAKFDVGEMRNSLTKTASGQIR